MFVEGERQMTEEEAMLKAGYSQQDIWEMRWTLRDNLLEAIARRQEGISRNEMKWWRENADLIRVGGGGGSGDGRFNLNEEELDFDLWSNEIYDKNTIVW